MSQLNGSLEAVKVQYENKVCTITMARPEKNNGLDLQMRKELWAIFAALKEDNETQVVVLTGQGTHFSYGTFDPASRGATDKDTIVRMVLEGNMLIDDLENLPQITIAAVNGPARGSGVEISLACDIRYAAASASFQQHEADMGGFPGGGAPLRLPMIVGYARTIEMLCTARAVPAGEAKDYGLVLDVFPDEGFLDEVVQRAQYMATKGPIGLRGTKRVAKVRQAPGKADARLLSNKLRRELEFSRDVAEAIDAHKEGRSPVFLGY
ncbi:enoyl-CoA hydratase/isomerase family protein [Tardibacter chloracetimidivorans]|nr:enoyl-CoA hydratase/isomerase family protein [Tardibacter chloracetimidivorans]